MQRPTASVLLLTYNQEAYVKEALESLLGQNEDALEIVVSDDASSDATWHVISDIADRYQGPKRLVMNRNPQNFGVVGNYYRAFGLSSGDLIFTAAGDDLSLPNRCSVTLARWHALDEKPDLIAADGFDMALNGEVLGEKKTGDLSHHTLASWYQHRPFIFGASHMMTRRLVGLRSLSPLLPYEDQSFLARALMMGGAHNLRMPLVKHRRGGISQTKTKLSLEAKREKFIQAAQAALVEHDEIMQDANELKLTEIENFLIDGYQLNKYVLDLLGEKSFSKQIEVARKYKSIAFRKHIKYFGFAIKHQLRRLSLGVN